jgi:hypothetical protein
MFNVRTLKLDLRHASLFAALATFVVANAVSAQSPSVTAVLSNSQVAVGETVQLQIRITGGRNAEAPEKIAVNGLEINRTGTSQRVEMNNFNVNSSVIYDYTILPLKAGTFKIPPQTIRVANTSLRTPELTLNVADSKTGGSTRSTQSAQTANASKLAFAELIVAKKTAFVGEMVPVEIRLGFDPRAHPKLVDGPEISGQGFTAQKLQQSGERLETIDGKSYDVVTFKTAIAAARAGKFEVGPVKAKAQVLVSRRPSAPSRSRSPFDLFNLDDPFADPFFADPFGQFGERRVMEINSEPVAFEVKSLPPNSPPGFSGAIGNFTLATEAKPTKVQAGDPITVTSTISGRGNFDRVTVPGLEDERGWHKYPPSSKFKQDDDVGISGAKTFETVFSPSEKKQAIPPFVFGYFDPVKESYVTLRSDPIPIQVEGGAAPATTAAVPATASATPATIAAKTSSKPQDILYQLTERPSRSQSFAPLYARPVFWSAQIIPLLGLLGFLGWRIRQRRLGDREARRRAGLQQESVELLRRLRRSELSPQEYFSDASRAVRIKTALAKNMDPNAVDAETAAAVFELGENERAQLHRLFQRSDELRYSGRANGAGTILREDRRQVLELIESLHV